jgi:hypothetical protein
MKWPKPGGIPEGHYCFTLDKEPELRKIKTKNGESRAIDIHAVSDPGEFTIKDSFVPWDIRYKDLCDALHVEHGADIRVEGASFEADVVYEPDRDDPSKSWPRLKNIRPAGEFAPKTGDEDGDIPF